MRITLVDSAQNEEDEKHCVVQNYYRFGEHMVMEPKTKLAIRA